SGAVDAESHPFTAQAPGEFVTDLAAGSYTATVRDAFSAEPLSVGGLVVTAQDPNVFTFELAPVMSVTLSAASEELPAGSTTAVRFVDAPPVPGLLSIGPVDAGDYSWVASRGTDP